MVTAEETQIHAREVTLPSCSSSCALLALGFGLHIRRSYCREYFPLFNLSFQPYPRSRSGSGRMLLILIAGGMASTCARSSPASCAGLTPGAVSIRAPGPTDSRLLNPVLDIVNLVLRKMVKKPLANVETVVVHVQCICIPARRWRGTRLRIRRATGGGRDSRQGTRTRGCYGLLGKATLRDAFSIPFLRVFAFEDSSHRFDA